MNIFAVKNGNFTRKGFSKRAGQEILRNISFDLQKGEVLSILGKNGAGKTTLIKCLMGLLIWESGESYLMGANLANLSRKEVWSNIAYVAQAKSHIFNITALEMVILGCNPFVRFCPRKEHYDKAYLALEKLKLLPLARKSCASLSGGELQMVLFARSLVGNPKLLVLDEPESNLDFANVKIILEMLKQLSGEGCTIILNTHFPANAAYLSHKVLLLHKIADMEGLARNEIYSNAPNGDMIHTNALFGLAQDVLNEKNLSSLYGVNIKMDDKCEYKGEFVLRV